LRTPTQIETQTPAPQRCPDEHWESVEHAQKPSMQFPLDPHWAFVTQVPHVPPTQASPPPHWLLDEHAAHAPSMHASPPDVPIPAGCSLQSANVEQGPHAPFLHTCPEGHPGKHPALGSTGVQTPEEHVSPEAQSPSTEQVHSIAVWVAAHCAVGPHWLSNVHA
jgi:hypothetical protein